MLLPESKWVRANLRCSCPNPDYYLKCSCPNECNIESRKSNRIQYIISKVGSDYRLSSYLFLLDVYEYIKISNDATAFGASKCTVF